MDLTKIVVIFFSLIAVACLVAIELNSRRNAKRAALEAGSATLEPEQRKSK